MKNTERLPKDILADIKGNVPMKSKQEEFTDDEINNKSPDELFDHWCNWNGFMGWSESIKRVIEEIYNVKLP